MSRIITVVNQKGGVGKTTTTINLGIGLARRGKRVLLVDADSQGNTTCALGYRDQDDIEPSLGDILANAASGREQPEGMGVLHHKEGIDLIPGNILLADMELDLVSRMCRESIMKDALSGLMQDYDYVLIDCAPSLGIITVNALIAANEVIVPVKADVLSLKGLESLYRTIRMVRSRLNRTLTIRGILLTMVDSRTNLAKEVCSAVRDQDGYRVFQTSIPCSVKLSEAPAAGKSIFLYDPRGKAAKAYEELVGEVLANG